MKRAIVSGATGAIGMALIAELLRHDVEVLVLCREDSRRIGQLPSHPLLSIRRCALDQLARAENDTGREYDVFYHFAWSGTTGAERDDMDLQIKNVAYALDAVRAARRFGCHAFIGAGSQAEYGRTEGPLSAHTSPFPESGYGIAKLCAGQMTRGLCAQLSLTHIWIRILSVYGPYDNAKSLVSQAIDAFLGGRTFACTKGEQQWDYLYSGDAARAFRLSAQKGRDGAVYCLGSGEVRSLEAYIRAIRDACGSGGIAFGAIPYPGHQVMHLQADISELARDTGFRPEVRFEEGIKKTIDSLQNRKA